MDTRSTLETSSPDLSGGFSSVPVETITLDGFARDLPIAQISLIKMDVEGHELKVIGGGHKVLTELRPFLLIEIEPRHYDGDLQEAFTTLDKLNYTIYFFNRMARELEMAYESGNIQSTSVGQDIHNYVCIPKEKSNVVHEINAHIQDRA